MTDKQIIIDNIDVSGCEFFETKAQVMQCHIHALTQRCKANNCYYKQLKRKEQECERFVEALKNKTDEYNKLAVNYDAYVSMANKQLKRKEQECETLASQLDFEVQKKECLEQECERLKNIINVAKNSKLDLKSFLVGEAIQKEYEQQLDQLKAENDELKDDKIYLQDRVGKLERAILRRNDELDQLKSDNKHLNGLLDQALKELEETREVLEKVREVCQKDKDFCVSCEGDGNIDCIDCTEGGKAKLAIQILQICDEVNDGK